jgi:hypothetical protein
MREIANTAAQEFNNPNNRGLTIERKAAYSRFQSFRRNSVIAMISCASRPANLEGYANGAAYSVISFWLAGKGKHGWPDVLQQ